MPTQTKTNVSTATAVAIGAGLVLAASLGYWALYGKSSFKPMRTGTPGYIGTGQGYVPGYVPGYK